MSRQKIDWDLHAHLLGTMPDSKLAKMLSTFGSVVRYQRVHRGIPAYVKPITADLIDWSSAPPLGSMSDRALAEILGVGIDIVIRARKAKGIPPFRTSPHFVDWDDPAIFNLLGNVPDREIALLVGTSVSTIRHYRKKMGIQAYKFTYLTASGKSVNYPEALIDLYFKNSGVEYVSQEWVGRYKPDWLIGNQVVEYAGFAEHPKFGETYKANLVKKIEYYESRGYTTLVIWEKDLKNYDLGLSPPHTGHLVIQGVDFTNLPLLGKITDEDLGVQLGIDSRTIGRVRSQLGIPVFQSEKQKATAAIDWSSVTWLDTDALTAKSLGTYKELVHKKRLELGIPAKGRSNNIDWAVQGLGTDTDKNIAKRLGVSISVVRDARIKRGISAFRPQLVSSEDLATICWADSNQTIGQRLGVTQWVIKNLREYLKIPSKKFVGFIDWEDKSIGLGTDYDKNIALKLGVKTSLVRSYRTSLGIPPFGRKLNKPLAVKP